LGGTRLTNNTRAKTILNAAKEGEEEADFDPLQLLAGIENL